MNLRRGKARRFKAVIAGMNEKIKTKQAEKIGRIDADEVLREKILPYCRLKPGQIWTDDKRGHKVGVLDASNHEDAARLTEGKKAALALNDPPYNVKVGGEATGALSKLPISDYMKFSRRWVANCAASLADDAHFYVWLGMDVKDGFQPLPDFMLMMRSFKEFKPRNFITMRNQRGYGTQKNWMWVRQELLYYIKGSPKFNVGAEYTDIPKILRNGYYKIVGDELTDNLERGKSDCIRAGNVWVDVQQIFYRLHENVPGCYAQKPLKAVERIVEASTDEGDLIIDLFAHSGATLIAGERLGRTVYTADIDPVFAEIAIRRLERYRETGETGFQWNAPFPEIE